MEAIPRGSETVLVVEDEDMVRRLAVQVLRKQGYKVLEAPNSGEAFLVCEQHQDPIHLILTDVVMPRMSGPEFIERMKHAGIGTSVHFIPLHMHPYYRDTFGYRREDFPNASYLYDRIISLPIYSKMTEGDVDRVIEAVADIVKKARR